jgi:hypothetical protein
MTAASSSSAGNVSLFILSPFIFRVPEDFDGERVRLVRRGL